MQILSTQDGGLKTGSGLLRIAQNAAHNNHKVANGSTGTANKFQAAAWATSP